MAPPTGPRAGSSNRTSLRGTTRGTTRGAGVGKRRGAPRTDRDGDVSMDSTNAANPPTGPSANSTRGNRGNRGGRGARGAKGTGPAHSSSRLAQNVRNYVSAQGGAALSTKGQPKKVSIKVHGLKDSKAASNPDGGLRSLLDFLERKSSKERPITLGRGVIRGDDVWLKVNQADAPHLLRLNGYTYAGAELTIEEASDPTLAQTNQSTDNQEPKSSETKDRLLVVLASRYNTEQKLLDLSALGTDPTLIAMGAFESKALAEKSFKALLRLISMHYDNSAEKEAAIQAITLANNDIHDVGEVFSLAHNLPRLRRLDLSGNGLGDFSKISKWRHEFRRLEELHLVGNPVTGLPNYPTQIIEWFPNLQILDGHRVRTPEEAAAALKAWFPVPLPSLPSNLQDGGNNVASTFLHGFFTAYDHDRPALAREFYDEDSAFTLVTGPEAGSDAYFSFSRNLGTISARNPSVQQRLFTGANLIAELWARLPATRHASLDRPDEWKIDCHTFASLADPSGPGSAMGLTIRVKSRFEEVDPTQQLAGTRKFCRAFTLGPSKPGAPHPYRVISDDLTVEALKPQEMPSAIVHNPVVAPVSAAPTLAQPPVLDDVTRAQMVQELSRQTGMTPEYSELCLAGMANWDYDLALRSFEEKKGELPMEAFIRPA